MGRVLVGGVWERFTITFVDGKNRSIFESRKEKRGGVGLTGVNGKISLKLPTLSTCLNTFTGTGSRTLTPPKHFK